MNYNLVFTILTKFNDKVYFSVDIIMRNVTKLKKKFLICALLVISLIILFNPNFNNRANYIYISKDEVWNNLHIEAIKNLNSNVTIECNYEKVLRDDRASDISLVEGDLVEEHHIKEGGEYVPMECKPKFSTAIIVPYRDQAEQLRNFLSYMHTYLRLQHIHYRIYVVEQVDSKPYNRAKLLNIGAQAALRAGYPCVVLHEVNLLPLQPANLYSCTKFPRHMSSSINQFRFNFPYLNIFGGVIAITSKQLELVNGMSNEFFGVSGVYEDFHERLKANDLKVCRFEPSTSRYHMAENKYDHKGSPRRELLTTSKERMLSDGLNSLKFSEVATVMHPLFTHIMVDL